MLKAKYIGYDIARVHKSMRAHFHDLIRPYDVTVQQFEILRIIGDNGGITAAQLVESLVSDSSTVMSILKRLEMKMYIVRRPDEGDRRSKLIHLTTQGEKILRDLLVIAAAYDAQVIEACDSEELAMFSRILSKLYDFSQRKIVIEAGKHKG